MIVERDFEHASSMQCTSSGRAENKERTQCSTTGPARDFNPGGNMCTAGLSHPVVKETHACEFASFPIARFPLHVSYVGRTTRGLRQLDAPRQTCYVSANTRFFNSLEQQTILLRTWRQEQVKSRAEFCCNRT